jgi:uncharacterized protein (TIGR03086 family)
VHTNTRDLLALHRTAVLASIDVVNTVGPDDLTRPTPCAGWNLVDLLAHMTVQHRGFAAAARGCGDDPEFWRPETVLASVTADPAGAYAAAAHDVLDAFAADGTADVEFALPDFGPGAKVPGVMAMGFDLVNRVTPKDLQRATPCDGWNLSDLLAHMTVQHHGFAAAARGDGANPAHWDATTVADAVAIDPAGTYAAAAADLLEAFADDDVLAASFALPEFGPGAAAPGSQAVGFHFVDYVVHGWDVAAALGAPYELPADVLTAVLPLAMAVPDGEFREQAGAPFARSVAPEGTDDFTRILRHLGRRPDWDQAYSTVTGA